LPGGQASIDLIIFDSNALNIGSFYQRLSKVAYFVNFGPVWQNLVVFYPRKINSDGFSKFSPHFAKSYGFPPSMPDSGFKIPRGSKCGAHLHHCDKEQDRGPH
jgi:hypothetical protein